MTLLQAGPHHVARHPVDRFPRTGCFIPYVSYTDSSIWIRTASRLNAERGLDPMTAPFSSVLLVKCVEIRAIAIPLKKEQLHNMSPHYSGGELKSLDASSFI